MKFLVHSMLRSKDDGDVKESVMQGRMDKPKRICLLIFFFKFGGHNKTGCEYEQEIPQSHTVDQPTVP